MRSSTAVAQTSDFSVHTVRCTDHRSGWSDPEPGVHHQLVLVRAGRFRMRSRQGRAVIDATTGYAQRPGGEWQFAHPAGGDVCTAITFTTDLWDGPQGTVRVDASADLAHRLLLRTGPDAAYDAAERLVGLLAQLPGGAAERGAGTGPAAATGAGRGTGAGRALADDAREVIVADHPDAAGLVSLARLLEISPSHLSRVFRSETGMSVTRFRNRIRVQRALDRIEHGDTDLAGLAADLGFADHAHLTRTVKTETGHPPSALRRLLHPGDQPPPRPSA